MDVNTCSPVMSSFHLCLAESCKLKYFVIIILQNGNKKFEFSD